MSVGHGHETCLKVILPIKSESNDYPRLRRQGTSLSQTLMTLNGYSGSGGASNAHVGQANCFLQASLAADGLLLRKRLHRRGLRTVLLIRLRKWAA